MPRLRTMLLLAILGLAALAVACGGDDDDDDVAANGGGGDDDVAAATVAVDLDEWSVKPDPDSIAAGEVTFVVSNSGTLAHELIIVRTDLAADALPVEAGLVAEAEVDVIGEIEEFAAGLTERVTFTLEAGTYVLLCNIPGHYGAGMTTSFTVE